MSETALDFDWLPTLVQISISFLASVFCSFFDGYKVLEYEFPDTDVEAMNTIGRDAFPARFGFGVASEAYRATVHDYRANQHCCGTRDEASREIKRDSYGNYREDIARAKRLRGSMYRITLRWSWIQPDGFAGPVDLDAILHYEDVLEEVLENDMTPMVTLFHRDIPYPVRQLGGWTNPRTIEWFAAYAELVFAAFGEQVKHWVTFEDPVSVCILDYGGTLSPVANLSGIADYICGQHVLLAHARVYHLYRGRFYDQQKGKVGIAQNFTWFEPEDETSERDVLGAEVGFHWYNGWITSPLFGEDGDYPRVMRDRLIFKSRVQECAETRLPLLTDRQREEIRAAADFLGVRFDRVKRARGVPISLRDSVSFEADAGMRVIDEPCTENESWALGKLLDRLHNDYALPEIYVTASCCVDASEYEEDAAGTARCPRHTVELLKAMQRGVDVRGYTGPAVSRSP